MASNAGPPQGELKWMTPYPIANDPPTPKPIPDVVHPTKSPAERASQRFSLAGKRAIGMSFTISFLVHHLVQQSPVLLKVWDLSPLEPCSSTVFLI